MWSESICSGSIFQGNVLFAWQQTVGEGFAGTQAPYQPQGPLPAARLSLPEAEEERHRINPVQERS